MGAKRLGYGGETTRVKNRGETTRGESTRGGTSLGRNVSLPWLDPTIVAAILSKGRHCHWD